MCLPVLPAAGGRGLCTGTAAEWRSWHGAQKNERRLVLPSTAKLSVQPRATQDSPFRSAVENSKNFRVVDGVVKRMTPVKATLAFFVTAHKIEKAGQGHAQKMTLVIEETIHQPGSQEAERHVLLRQERELEISYFCRSVGKRIRLKQLAEAVFAEKPEPKSESPPE